MEQCLQTGDTAKAVKLLCQMAVSSAKAKDFIKAEAFRDRLYEVDGSALSAILKVNEIIESEKNKAITPAQRNLWSCFFNGLSAEEASDFIFALQPAEFPSDHVIFEQAKPNDRLYLIHQGYVKIVFENNSRQILIKTLGKGDFFGEDTFFSVNVCTASAVTLSDVKLGFLDKEGLERLKTKHRFLWTSLRKICLSGRSVFDCLRQKGTDRREHPRVNLQTKVSVQILASENGKPISRTLTAELWDISRQGLSFYFQSKNPNAVRRMVGRTLKVRVFFNFEGKKKELDLTGLVQGVQDHPMDEFSVHLKLYRPFSFAAMRTIQQIASRPR